LQHPQVLQAIEERIGEVEKARQNYRDGLLAATQMAQASFLGQFPELAAIAPENLPGALELMSRQDPAKFARVRSLIASSVLLRAGLFVFILTAVDAFAARTHAEQSGNAPCAGRLKMFVLLIDDLFARRVVVAESYYELMRSWLPDKGEERCRVEEALSILAMSKFFVKPRPSSIEVKSSYEVVVLRNEDLYVTFSLDIATGVFGYRAVSWNKNFP
jgi:hypothetical protein